VKLCVLLLLVCCALPAQTTLRAPGAASPATVDELIPVSGKLVNAVTGQPVPQAVLIFNSVQQIYNVTTGADGGFSLADVRPGRYRMAVTKPGFATSVYTGRILEGLGSILFVDAGQSLKTLTLRILPHSVITGRITGPEGDPVIGARVEVFGVRYLLAGKQLFQVGSSTTNDLGEYRIFGLAPGKYLVAATVWPQAESIAAGRAHPRPSIAENEYVQTYYPGVAEIAAASTVEIVPGGQASDINVRLSYARTAPVRGRVVHGQDIAGNPRALVILAPRKTSDAAIAPSNRTFYADADGAFEFPGVAPGSYDLFASVDQGGRMFSTRAQIEVGADPIENLTLAIGPGLTLTGHVRVDDDLSRPPNLRAQLIRSDTRFPGGPAMTAPVSGDGTFSITNVSPDRYTVQVYPVPAGYYVKGIRSADRDVLLSGLDLMTGPAASLEVVFSSHGGDITGLVNTSATEPAPGAVVVMIPQNGDSSPGFRRSIADQRGAFAFRGLAPGEYRILAFEEMNDERFLDPDFLKPLEGQGETITVREGSRKTVQLRVISANLR
jgi:protocatechuate 3,4-dioxygenase beta subunit